MNEISKSELVEIAITSDSTPGGIYVETKHGDRVIPIVTNIDSQNPLVTVISMQLHLRTEDNAL